MQITLNQADIEQAIAEFIGRTMKFAEGVKPVIDLKATRGPEGFTATIDLSDNAGAPAAASKPAVLTQPRKTGLVLKPQPVAVVAQEPAQDAAAEPETTEAADTPVEATEAVSEAGEPVEAEAEPTEGEEAPPAEKPKSLFANLSKPRNS